MNDAMTALLEIIQLMEATKLKIEALRAMRVEEQIDGRALSIAVTNLETAQLWIANANRNV